MHTGFTRNRILCGASKKRESVLSHHRLERLTAAIVIVVAAIALTLTAGCSDGGSTTATSSTGPTAGFASKLQAEAANTVSVAAAGDVNFGDGVTPYISSEGVDYPWTSASAVFAQGDVSFVNLECCLSTGGSPVVGKEFTFEGPPDAAVGMKQAGIDVVSLANNHSKDYGGQAFVDTLNNLRAQGIAYCGAGMNSTEAYSPAILDAQGKKVAFVAFSNVVPDGWPATSTTPGCAVGWSTPKVTQTIKDAKAKADFVVASFHWGIELATSPGGDQRSLAHAAVDAGADVVLGHHPHVVQGFEVYKNRLIAYSLGNFVFSPPREISAKTLSILVALNKNGLRQAKIVPMVISSCRPVIITGQAAASWLATVQGYSSQLGTKIDIRGERGFIEGAVPAAPGSANVK